MTVSLVKSCTLIGICNFWLSGISTNNRYNHIRNFVSIPENLLLFYHYLEEVYITIITFLYNFVLLLCHGYLERNLGPKKLKKNSLSVCHRILKVYLLITSRNLHS